MTLRTFSITIVLHCIRYHLEVEQLPSENKSLEVFKIYPKDNPDRAVVMQSNRPVLLRHKLKHKPIDWKMTEGKLLSRHALEKVLVAIEEELKKVA